MNYNQFSKPEVNYEFEVNSRAKLDTGLKCNYKCFFCYYRENLKDPEISLEEIKRRINIIKESGIKQIDLSGGESTIHSKWFEILDYCKENFEKVSCLSNGTKLKDIEFAKNSKYHGLSEVLFSLHGYDKSSHDKIVGYEGAFKDILKAIKNCQELEIEVRLNCTVTSRNMKHLDVYSNLIKSIRPSQLNYLPLNYWDNAQVLKAESYESLSKYIKKSIDLLSNEDIEINVRYMPYCFMIDYEEYVCDTFQHIHDLKDWNVLVYDLKEFKKFDVDDMYKEAFNKRNYTYYKPQKCFNCKYFFICDGIEKNIKDSQEIFPISGDKIKNVMEFRK